MPCAKRGIECTPLPSIVTLNSFKQWNKNFPVSGFTHYHGILTEKGSQQFICGPTRLYCKCCGGGRTAQGKKRGASHQILSNPSSRSTESKLTHMQREWGA